MTNLQIAGLFLLVVGIAHAALAGFAWPMYSKLPMNRLRSAIFSPGVTRVITMVAGLLGAGLGCYLLIA